MTDHGCSSSFQLQSSFERKWTRRYLPRILGILLQKYIFSLYNKWLKLPNISNMALQMQIYGFFLLIWAWLFGTEVYLKFWTAWNVWTHYRPTNFEVWLSRGHWKWTFSIFLVVLKIIWMTPGYAPLPHNSALGCTNYPFFWHICAAASLQWKSVLHTIHRNARLPFDVLGTWTWLSWVLQLRWLCWHHGNVLRWFSFRSLLGLLCLGACRKHHASLSGAWNEEQIKIKISNQQIPCINSSENLVELSF